MRTGGAGSGGEEESDYLFLSLSLLSQGRVLVSPVLKAVSVNASSGPQRPLGRSFQIFACVREVIHV